MGWISTYKSHPPIPGNLGWISFPNSHHLISNFRCRIKTVIGSYASLKITSMHNSQIFNPCCSEFIWENASFAIISQHTGSGNPPLWKKPTHLSYILNIIAADALATSVARASAAMVLTNFSWNIPALPKRFHKFLNFNEYSHASYQPIRHNNIIIAYWFNASVSFTYI